MYQPSQQSTHISPILELYVRQVCHQKFPRFCLDNVNEAESMLPQLFSSMHWWEVWVCANDLVRVSPWHHKFLQHFCTMMEIVSIILLLFLIFCRLQYSDPHHNSWPTACRILDLWPIPRLLVYCHIHWKTQIDPMTTLSIPPIYGLIITHETRRRESLCAILIKTSNKIFNEFPPMILMDRTLTFHIWLIDPSNMPP